QNNSDFFLCGTPTALLQPKDISPQFSSDHSRSDIGCQEIQGGNPLLVLAVALPPLYVKGR
ncbi:hypothetical protein ACIL3W_005104, partial [Escherichia coli]